MSLRGAITQKISALRGFFNDSRTPEGALAVFGDNLFGGGQCQVIGTSITFSMGDAQRMAETAKKSRATYPPSVEICRYVNGRWNSVEK